MLVVEGGVKHILIIAKTDTRSESKPGRDYQTFYDGHIAMHIA